MPECIITSNHDAMLLYSGIMLLSAPATPELWHADTMTVGVEV